MRIILGIVAGSFLITAGWTRVGGLVKQAPPRASAMSNPMEGQSRVQQAGAKLFRRECSECHGPNGEGGLGKAPPLIKPEVYEATPGALFWVLRNGSLRRGMPSFAHLPAAQRWQIVTYLRTLRPH